MDLTQAINQPLAVVLILVAVFGFLMMGLDKLTYFVKTITKKTPMDKMSTSYDLMASTITKVSTHMDKNTEALTHLNNKMTEHEKMAALRHEQLIRELDRK